MFFKGLVPATISLVNTLQGTSRRDQSKGLVPSFVPTLKYTATRRKVRKACENYLSSVNLPLNAKGNVITNYNLEASGGSSF